MGGAMWRLPGLQAPLLQGCVARNPGNAVILSGAKNLCDSSQILRFARNDANAMKSCRTLAG